MDIAERYIDETNRQQRAKLRYHLRDKGSVVHVDEDTALVDGIGGTTWEGALVLARVMETIAASADNADDVSHCHVLEVGCGTGILGIVTHQLGFRTTITDRVVDLAASNLQQNEAGATATATATTASPTRKRRALSTDDASSSKTCKTRTQELMHSVDPDYLIEEDLSRSLRVAVAAEERSYAFAEQVQVVALPWGNNLFLQHLQQQTFTAAAPAVATAAVGAAAAAAPTVPQSIDEAVAGFHRNQAAASAPVPATATATTTAADIWNVPRVCRERGNVDIVVGAEITCLRKQQTLLIETLCDVAKHNPKVVVLLTFDGLFTGPSTAAPSNYEREFLAQMKAQRFRYSVVTQATVRWRSTATAGHKIATLVTHPTVAASDSTVVPVVFPRPAAAASTAMDVDAAADDDATGGAFDDVFHHHVLAFYRSDAVLTCQRCHREFFAQSNHRSPSQSGNLFNPARGASSTAHDDDRCRYHSGLYVCRRHPAETRCSINGLGDQLGYYGTGQEGWKAEFWDCCGAEDPQAAGCCVDRHVPY